MYKLFAILFFASLLSCYEEIDLPTQRGQEDTNVVIQGDFIKGELESKIKVYVSKTAGKQSFSELIRVNSIVIENDLGDKVFLDEDTDGGYSKKVNNTDNTFSTQEGRKLRLTAVDYSNNIIRSSYQTISIGPKFDSIWYKVDNRNIIGIDNIIEEAEFIDIYGRLRKNENVDINYFYNDFDHHYVINEQIENLPITRTCYVVEKIPTPIQQFNANEINANGALKFPITSIQSNNKYAEDSYMSITLNSIDEKAFIYRSTLASLLEKNKTIFSNSNDRLISNFSVEGNPELDVFGYFTVATQATNRIKLFAQDFKKIKKNCPSELDEIGNCVRPQCCNCLIVKGSSEEKPHFWK